MDTRLHGRWLLLARVGWVVVVTVAFGLFVASLPSYVAYLHHLCSGAQCLYNTQLTPTDVRQLRSWGLGLNFDATFLLVFNVTVLAIPCVVGAVIFWRRSDDWMALLMSFVLVVFSLSTFVAGILGVLPHTWWFPVTLLSFLGEVGASLIGYLFPDGHFVPGWTRWLAAALIPYWFVNVFLFSSFNIVLFGLFLGLLGSIMLAQIDRYRYVSSPVQRQQTKWAVFGIVIALGSNILATVARFTLIPRFFPYSHLTQQIDATVLGLALLLIPLTLAAAILRYRLWDVDVLINRTLVYGTLSAILLLVYVVCIVGLQAVFRGLLQQTSELAIVVSTLVIAALFQPLRARLQTSIDRRFYRSTYDAARLLTAFGETLSQEVDVSHLRDQLLALVQQTMQPTQVSLWLRPREPSVPPGLRFPPRLEEHGKLPSR
jgi:hypothetical protein